MQLFSSAKDLFMRNFYILLTFFFPFLSKDFFVELLELKLLVNRGWNCNASFIILNLVLWSEVFMII